MADLIDRISGVSKMMTPFRDRIPVHSWVGLQRLYALNLATRLEVATEFGFLGNPDEERQATQIADQIDAQSNAANKGFYIARVEAVFMCVSNHRIKYYRNPDGSVNKPLVYSHLQITG
jgi:hypothetical protein